MDTKLNSQFEEELNKLTTEEKKRFHIKSFLGLSTFMLVLIALLLFLSLLSLCVGQYSLTIPESLHILVGKLTGAEQDWSQIAENVVFGLRLPRVIGAALVGAALSVSGAVYQSIFKNPLVSPDLLGVSTGACVGAAIAILMGFAAAGLQISAFIFGMVTVGLTLLVPRIIKSDSNIMLVLSGIIVGGLMSSVLGFIKYIADPETELASIVYWQMGSLAYVDPSDIISVLPTMAFGFVILLIMAWWIDVLSLGDKEARSLGVNVRAVRNLSILSATLLTASAIVISGTVGWIGLVIPHFARLFVGPQNNKLLPAAMLLGAIFLVAVDLAARMLTTVELPLSVLTGFIGAPFYVVLLYKQKEQMSLN